jgi:hypothetical protein
VGKVTQDFDWAWTRFEQQICLAYYSTTNSSEAIPNDLFTIMLSETIIRSLAQGYFPQEDLNSCEPYLMIVIPRLSIVYGLFHAPEYLCANATERFGNFSKQLADISHSLWKLRDEEITELELMLAKSVTNDINSTLLQKLYRDISFIASQMQTEKNTKIFSTLLGKVFGMHELKKNSLTETRNDIPFARSHQQIKASAIL